MTTQTAHATQQTLETRLYSIVEAMEMALADVDACGPDVLSPFQGQHSGDYARPRSQELAAAVNRLPSLAVRQV